MLDTTIALSQDEVMPSEGRVYFGLSGDGFDPLSLTIGVDPTKTVRKGDPIPSRDAWIYSTERISSDLIDIYEMSASLVSALQPHAAKIREAIQSHDLEAVLEVVVTISVDHAVSTPAVGFDSKVISFLNEVGATIDIDIYRG